MTLKRFEVVDPVAPRASIRSEVETNLVRRSELLFGIESLVEATNGERREGVILAAKLFGIEVEL